MRGMDIDRILRRRCGMRKIQGFTVAQIAAKMGVSESTVRKKMSGEVPLRRDLVGNHLVMCWSKEDVARAFPKKGKK
jgi:predicted transcriptional regulator